jgi:hypothetical protein
LNEFINVDLTNVTVAQEPIVTFDPNVMCPASAPPVDMMPEAQAQPMDGNYGYGGSGSGGMIVADVAAPAPGSAISIGSDGSSLQRLFNSQEALPIAISVNEEEGRGRRLSIGDDYRYDEATKTVRMELADWPHGLQNVFIDNCSKHPMRFMILDNSGSMLTPDGNRIETTSKGEKRYDLYYESMRISLSLLARIIITISHCPNSSYLCHLLIFLHCFFDDSSVPCTRWDELTDSMLFHANLAKVAQAPTEFRLLNWADPVVIGQGHGDQPYNTLMGYLKRVCNGFICCVMRGNVWHTLLPCGYALYNNAFKFIDVIIIYIYYF